MHYWRWLTAGALVLPLAGWAPALPQETDAGAAAVEAADGTEAPATAEAAAAADAEDLLDEDELDTLVAPIALYPDALLAQIFVAATYPLDIVKADRFVDANTALTDKERNDKAQAEDWDPSVAALAGGFPTVVQRMADEIDWTENLGDATLAQTDDVLDAVQRMRSRAVASGNLVSNEAQVVEDDGDSIAIEPADPDVVYVPSYDATAAYAPAPVATTPVATTSTGLTTTGLLTTGVIAFGSAMLVNEIFDDDDDWDDYWHGPSHVDWDDGDFYPRPGGINVNGDVNIDRDIDRDRVRIGDNDRSVVDREGAWKADPDRQRDARNKLAARDIATGAGTSAAAREKLSARSGDGAAREKLSARSGDSGARDKLQAAGTRREAAGKPPVANSAFKPGDTGRAKTAAAANRGTSSIGKAKLPESAKARPAAAKAAKAHPKAVSRASAAKAPPRKASPKSSAFSKSSSGNRAKAASARGNRSHGGGGGGRGGGGGGGRSNRR